MLLQEIFKSRDFDYHVISDSEFRWSVSTELTNGDVLQVGATRPSMKAWTISFKVNGDFNLTSKGNEFEVFSKVLYLLEIFFKKVSPEQIFMEAEESNRYALYKRMMKRLIPDWKIITFHQKGYTNCIAAAKNEFQVVEYEGETTLRLSQALYLGYKEDGTPNDDLESVTDMNDTLVKELEKLRGEK